MLSSKSSASERLEAALARIASREGSKAFTDVFADRARREAKSSDARLAAGKRLGPLDGRIVDRKSVV